jgi:hypothetical protein
MSIAPDLQRWGPLHLVALELCSVGECLDGGQKILGADVKTAVALG